MLYFQTVFAGKFYISDPEKPLWRFLIQPETWRDFEGGLDNPQYDLRYRVEIDARTGDIRNGRRISIRTNRLEGSGKRTEMVLTTYEGAGKTGIL